MAESGWNPEEKLLERCLLNSTLNERVQYVHAKQTERQAELQEIKKALREAPNEQQNNEILKKFEERQTKKTKHWRKKNIRENRALKPDNGKHNNTKVETVTEVINITCKPTDTVMAGRDLIGKLTKASAHQDCKVSPISDSKAASSMPTYNQNALKLYSNWTLFHNRSLEFLETQQCLLALTRAESVANMCNINEADHLCHQTAEDILRRVRELAGHLQTAQVDILVKKVIEEKVMNEHLQSELKKLKDEASEFTLLTDSLDHSELAERLEFQTARLADKDSQLTELKERLAAIALNRDVSTSDTKDRAIPALNADEDAFEELSNEAVLDLEPRLLIRHIRKELGIGMESFNPIHRRVMRAMRSKLGSALEKLAHDIYSNDSQIVLELIQNADDNYYNDVTPFLSISMCSEKSIFVTNNECGFNNANVIAISNIGGSTKKDVSRFTGHKGIGFKSVFKVTRTPYIISKDFCFRFNLDGANTEDNIGYILPEWVEREDIDALIAPEHIDSNMTHFYFPLSETSRFPAEELYQGINLIPLFLRQLHTIELGLDGKKKIVVINKQARQNELLEMYHLLVTEYTTLADGGANTEVISDIKYRVYRRMLDVPKDLQIDPAGRMIPVKTELILAFPTIPDSVTDPRDVEIQKVYSYLPVEKAGFRFLIQADFHLVSSRDRVHAQNLYNRWLSTMIPAAFKEAFELGNDVDQRIQVGSLRNDLFLFLPTPYDLSRTGHSETSTDGFWRRVMKGIRDKVLDTPCVLTETSKWAKPDQVCVRPKGYEDLFTNAELQTALSKEWVSKSLVEDAIYGLGCQYLSPSEALTIVNHQSFCATLRPKQWFYKLYGFLGSQIKRYSDFIDQILCAKIFPLDTGDITSLQAGRLFRMTPAGLYKIGPHVLRLLDMDSADLFPGDSSLKFMESVGIISMTALDVANSIWATHLRLKKPVGGMPASTTETTCEQFWEQLRFLKDHWYDISPLYPYLESKLMVPVSPKNMPDDKVEYHYASFVYFSDLKSEFEEISPLLIDQVLFLDDRYMNEVTNAQDKQAWIKFLNVQIGISRSLRVLPTDNKDYACSQELDYAFRLAVKEAEENDSVAAWATLLGHMQKNWDHFSKVKHLVAQIRKAPSGFRPLRINDLFPDLAPLKNLLLDKDGMPCICLPAIPGLTNVATMADLGIEATLSGDMLNQLSCYLEQLDIPDKSRVMDLFVWKKIYAAMVKHQAKPDKILIAEDDGSSRFESLRKMSHEIPSVLKEHCDLIQFPGKLYADVHGMEKWCKNTLSMQDYSHILFKIVKIDIPNKRSYEMQIIKCYQQVNALMSGRQHGGRIFLVFDKNCYLRGQKTANRLVMPDRMDIYQKFLPDPKAFCLILFVHPELAKLDNMAKDLCARMNIPLLSSVVQICPVPYFWHGYYVYSVGKQEIELPTYLSSSLTNLYRTILAEFQSKAKTLSNDENTSLGNLLRGILVFVLAVDAPKVPVAYTIYGVSRVCQEDYFIHKSVSGQVSVIVSPSVLRLPIEDHVNLDVLKELFPPLVVDNYLRTVIRRMLEGSVKPKLETLNMVQRNDELQMLPFEINVEDCEVVQSIQEQRQKTPTSGRPNAMNTRGNYSRITYAPQGRYVGVNIPGLTTSRVFSNGSSQNLSDHPFLARIENRPMSGQTTHTAQPHRQNSAQNSEGYREDHMHANRVANAGAPIHGDTGIARSPEERGPLREGYAHHPHQRTASKDSDSCDESEAQSASNVLVTNQTYENSNAGLQNTTSSIPPITHSEVRSSDVPAAAAHPENVVGNDNGTLTASTNFSEGSLPVAFGGSATSSSCTSRIRQIRNEIFSWPKIPVEVVEGRLFKGGELAYATPNSGQPSSTADPSFGINLRRLENEGSVARLIGIWAEKAVYNHLLLLCSSRRPLLNGSKTLGSLIRSFSMDNWISSSRENFDKDNRVADDGKGYDFYYEQTNGTTVYIEVKGHAAMTNSFLLSANEWEVAKSHSGSTNAVYVILGINLNTLTMEGARIEYFLEDPILLEGNGSITKRSHSYVIELFPKARDVPTSSCEDFGGNESDSETESVSTAKVNDNLTRVKLTAKRRIRSPKHSSPSGKNFGGFGC